MQPTVLLIDSNPAVQAITSLALTQLSINVQTLSSRKSAQAKIEELKPDLVLYAHDENDETFSFDLCRFIRTRADLSHIAYVLLVRNEIAGDLSAEVRSAGVTEVLLKPFKSEQLRNTVERILCIQPEDSTVEGDVLLLSKDTLLQKLLRATFEKRQIGISICETVDEARRMIEQKSFSATIVDTKALDLNAEDFSWMIPSQTGRVCSIVGNNVLGIDRLGECVVSSVVQPVSFAKIWESIGGFETGNQSIPLVEETIPLVLEEQSILAARISAGVFELLLTQNSLQIRDWEAAGNVAKNELLRICSHFQALSNRTSTSN